MRTTSVPTSGLTPFLGGAETLPATQRRRLAEISADCRRRVRFLESTLPGDRSMTLRACVAGGGWARLLVDVLIKQGKSAGGVSERCFGCIAVENSSCQAPSKELMEEDGEKAVGAFSCE